MIEYKSLNLHEINNGFLLKFYSDNEKERKKEIKALKKWLDKKPGDITNVVFKTNKPKNMKKEERITKVKVSFKNEKKE